TRSFVGELVAETEGARLVVGEPATSVGGVTQDSRRLEPGDLFVAIPGFERDGLEFVPEAVARGAAAVAAESMPAGAIDVPLIVVNNARRALADLSAAFYDHPSRHLPVVGVTGTDGKTSTTQLLSAILEARGLQTEGLAGLNADDPSSEVKRAATRARVLRYGLDTLEADLTAGDIRLAANGTTFTLLPSGLSIRTRLVGRFNVSNWLAAYAAATYFGATPDDLRSAASIQPPVPGRMNLVDVGQPFAIVVDFAHTPQALEKALDTIR